MALLHRLNNFQLAELVLDSGKATVNVSGLHESLSFPRVGVDNDMVGEAAATHLLERGFRHFACLRGGAADNSVRRSNAFARAVAKAGFSARIERSDLLNDHELFSWLVSLPKPVGMYSDDDPTGLRITEVSREGGLSIPQELALVSNDNDEVVCAFARPPVSSIDLSAKRIGFEAAALLDRLMAGDPAPAKPIIIPPRGVVTRQSTDALAIEDPDVSASVRFIREHAHEDIGIDDVLDVVPTSRRWLEKRFRRLVGHSLLQEIQRVRISRAKQLLIDTDLPMPEIARRAGFSTAARFSTIFRTNQSITPDVIPPAIPSPAMTRPQNGKTITQYGLVICARALKLSQSHLLRR